MYARKLNKNPDHRIAMLKTMSSQLLKNGKIKTTFAKAKEISVFVDRLITKSKIDSLHRRRQVFNRIRSEDIVNNLFNKIAISFSDRKGGYTRIIKLGMRRGDAAEMALIELIS